MGAPWTRTRVSRLPSQSLRANLPGATMSSSGSMSSAVRLQMSGRDHVHVHSWEHVAKSLMRNGFAAHSIESTGFGLHTQPRRRLPNLFGGSLRAARARPVFAVVNPIGSGAPCPMLRAVSGATVSLSVTSSCNLVQARSSGGVLCCVLCKWWRAVHRP